MKPIAEIVQVLVETTEADVVYSDESFLVFRFGDLGAVVAVGGGWDHIAVSYLARTPTYQEMKFVKRLCFEDSEWAYEVHPPPNKYISIHDNALHLWRPQYGPWRDPPLDVLMDPAAFERDSGSHIQP
jgi:hypothetical protein